MRLALAVLWFAILCDSSYARESFRLDMVQAYYDVLKDLPVDLSSDDSAIEEELARLELYKQFDPARYLIEKNLHYYNNRRQLGELDLVVFERRTGNVVLVAEVKRKRKVVAAINQAKQQLSNFERHITEGNVTRIESNGHPKISYPLDKFTPPWRKLVIGASVSATQHYPHELDITPIELIVLKLTMRRQQRFQVKESTPRSFGFANYWAHKTFEYRKALPNILAKVGCGLAFAHE